MKRVLICGGRDYADRDKLYREMDRICQERGFYHGGDSSGEPNWLPNVTVISGMARGADSLGCGWAETNWCPVLEFPADWRRDGRAAGPIRNQKMLDEGKPDVVVAFPGGRGTADMVQRSRRAGVEVLEIAA